MSDNDSELRAGHPRAVKVAGMRITQHRGREREVSNDSPHEDIGFLNVQSSCPTSSVVAGATVHGHSDYTVEAIQSFHEKPKPSLEPSRVNMKPIIHQPRK